MNNSDSTTSLRITIDRSAEQALAERVARMRRTGPPLNSPPATRAIQFLRGVSSRASLILPQFYLYLGSNASPSEGRPAGLIKGFPGLVFQHSVKFAAISAIALACRKIFDNDAKSGSLTGRNFAKISDQVQAEVAEYWAKSSNRSVEDAQAALGLLKGVFDACSKSDSELFTAAPVLGRRVGLLKQYANHSAAHLTLENYEFTPLDCAHLIGSVTIIGEIIKSFDDPGHSVTYFDDLDAASYIAARQLFPSIPERRLFEDIQIETQSRLCWQVGIDFGQDMLLQQLPYAIGWY